MNGDVNGFGLLASLVLIAVAVGISRWQRLGLEGSILVAVARATGQLLLVGLGLGLVLAEAVLITVLGGTLGLAGAWWLGVQFEPVFRQYLPGFRVPADAIVLGAVFMVGMGLAAGAVPATQAMRLRIVEALRRD